MDALTLMEPRADTKEMCEEQLAAFTAGLSVRCLIMDIVPQRLIEAWY
jgi:hypothetical protein